MQIMGEANENDRNTSQMLSLMQDVEFAYKLEEHEFKIMEQSLISKPITVIQTIRITGRMTFIMARSVD